MGSVRGKLNRLSLLALTLDSVSSPAAAHIDIEMDENCIKAKYCTKRNISMKARTGVKREDPI